MGVARKSSTFTLEDSTMSDHGPRILSTLADTSAPLATPVVHSQPPSPIVIGQTTALSGGASASAREMTVGASIYFDAVNLKGGVKGRPLKLITLDDGYDPTRAAANAATLIEEH